MDTTTLLSCPPPTITQETKEHQQHQQYSNSTTIKPNICKLDKNNSYFTASAAVNQFMDLFLYKLPALLKCPVCHNDLMGPVTLSCGYTVCQACIPAPRQGQYYQQNNLQQQQQPIFVCPVLQCQYTTHLFGRAQESCIDSVVQSLCLMFHYSSSSSSSVMTGTMATNNSMTTMSTINNNNTISQQQINNLMECYQCHGTFHQPTTTHCGHVYCRLCLLQLKLNRGACPKCQRPLPRYNYIQNQAAQNRILVTVLELMESSSSSLSFYRPRQQQQQFTSNMYGIPMFVTGLVILPYQHARIPVYMSNHIQMLRRSTFTSSQYNALCLPVVHRGRPNLSQFGTLVEIISVEHQQNPNGSTAVILEVRGRERFSTNCVNYEDRNMQDLSILLSDITFVPENLSATNTIPTNTSTTNTPGTSTDTMNPQQSSQQRIQELASQVHMFIEEIAAAPPLENVSAIPTSTFGLLGPLWFETMERVHGKLPSRDEPAALTWWTAVILPVSGAERYALLRTIHLQDRLELVLSWITQLDGQWKRWRQAAVNTVAAAIQPQSHQ